MVFLGRTKRAALTLTRFAPLRTGIVPETAVRRQYPADKVCIKVRPALWLPELRFEFKAGYEYGFQRHGHRRRRGTCTLRCWQALAVVGSCHHHSNELAFIQNRQCIFRFNRARYVSVAAAVDGCLPLLAELQLTGSEIRCVGPGAGIRDQGLSHSW